MLHPLLHELHQDHVHFGQILHLLERQLGLIRAGEDADLHVLGDIVDYVRSYPDLLHHPREDVIFLVYRERSSRGLDVIERLLDEHRSLIDKTADLRASLDSWLHDSPVPRDRIDRLISEYLRMQWEHLNLEESSVYELLMEGLTDEDWERIATILPQGEDLLYEQLVRKYYDHKFEQMAAYTAG
jgi:hemerythrin-like domain-containing protein